MSFHIVPTINIRVTLSILKSFMPILEFRKESVAHFRNCEVKLAREGDKMEVKLKSFTEIVKSEKVLTVPEQTPVFDMPIPIAVQQIQELRV